MKEKKKHMFTINAAHFMIHNFEIGINNHLSIVTSVKYFCRLLYHRMNFYHKIHTPSYQTRNLQSTLSTFKHWTIEVAIFRFRFIFKEKKIGLIVWLFGFGFGFEHSTFRITGERSNRMRHCCRKKKNILIDLLNRVLRLPAIFQPCNGGKKTYMYRWKHGFER